MNHQTTQSSLWIIREKETGKVIMETFDRRKVEFLNTAKYQAVPIGQYLASLNQNQGGNKMTKWKYDQDAPVKSENSVAVLPEAILSVARAAEWISNGEELDAIGGVITDLIARSEVGKKRYGMPLCTDNGRDAVADALAEVLDAVMYLNQAVMEAQGEGLRYWPDLNDAMNISIALAIKVKQIQQIQD